MLKSERIPEIAFVENNIPKMIRIFTTKKKYCDGRWKQKYLFNYVEIFYSISLPSSYIHR